VWRWALQPVRHRSLAVDGAAYNGKRMNEFSYKTTSKLSAFFSVRRVLGWSSWQRRKRQVVLDGYSLVFEQAQALETYLRERSIIAFVCPSIIDDRQFSVAVWRRDRKRALATLAERPIPPATG
jgi:hypothetical protein